MIQLPFSSARRAFVPAVALVCALLLSYFSIRNALAAHQAGLQTLQGYERATELEPRDAQNWQLLGRFWQYNLENSDAARAIQAYKVALAWNPRSADTWADLGSAYEAEGNIAAARDAFLHAKKDYTLSAEISWRYGNFLLRQGETDAAFLEMRRAVEVEPKRAAEALSRALSAEPNVNLVLDRVLPPLSTAYVRAIVDQTNQGHTANALEVWNRLAALHPKLRLENYSFSLVGGLLRENNMAEAQRVWRQAVDFAGLANLPEPAGSVLWDGGFESGVFGAGFAWALPAGAPGVQFSLDTREKHSGNRSLRLLFNGRYNLRLLGPCIEVPVQPSTDYDFSAWVRTFSITTEQGIGFQLQPLGTKDASTVMTNDVRGSQPWTRVEIPWLSGSDTQEMQVCVARLASHEVNDKIQGIAWVDDVALVPVAPVPGAREPRKP
jgi:tetratricopeptide (TPR) repeat protein